MKNVQQYDLFEVTVKDVEDAGLVEYCGIFTKGNTEKVIPAFKSNEKEYTVRFMPEETGIWDYKIELSGQVFSDEFECIACTGNNHGLVQAEDTHFKYADGSRYIPFGTTAYAWINQPKELQEQTLETLKSTCFNKIRMCIFPKSMPYNNNEPENFPFAVGENGKWDIGQPDFAFWNNLDERIKSLCELGIQADMILFHPYDRWGFAELSQQESLGYLEYCIARLAAYRNVWWSLANEYEMVYKKSTEDWNEYGNMLKQKDPYEHLISIHHIFVIYPKRDWMTHCSMQTTGLHFIPIWRQEYKIPIIIDECGYEGNIEHKWGNISAFEMVHRFWVSVCRGGFCTHGETFHRDDEVLWWAKGGVLYGESERRISFLKDILYGLPEKRADVFQTSDKNPNQEKENDKQDDHFKLLFEKASPDRQYDMISDRPMILFTDDYRLEYFGKNCPAFVKLNLPKDGQYRLEVIDIWAMTRNMIAEGISGQVKISLPGREGIAILISRMDGAPLIA